MFTSHALFSNTLYHTYLNKDNEKIIADCDTVKYHDPGRVRSNSGGYQSNDLDRNTLVQGKCRSLVDLIDTIQQTAAQLPEYLGPLCLDNVWINYNYYGNSNAKHTHYESCLAGTYYVMASNDDNGQITFVRERSETWQISRHFDIYNNTYTHPDIATQAGISLESGALIFFPGHLEHYVSINQTNQPRISISFNLMRPL